MDVKALLIVGGHPPNSKDERIAGVPVALLDVLGAPVLQRVIERITRLGVTSITVLSEAEESKVADIRNRLRPDIKWVHATQEDLWRNGEQQFNDFAQHGAELVLIARLGPYLDIDYEELVQFHLDRGARVSAVSDVDGVPFDCFLVSASRRNDAAHLLRNELKSARSECQNFEYHGYANRLRNAADLRDLTMASFAGECSIHPEGHQVKPGVWVSESAQIHPKARVLAPAYIGRHSKVCASAVITRGSVVEHHATIDCGTVVEGSSILPHCFVGAGLDVTHSVVGFKQIANIRRNATIQIHDDRLLTTTTSSAPLRVLRGAYELITYLPRTIAKGLRRKPICEGEEVAQAVNSTSPALNAVPQDESGHPNVPAFPTNLLTARRYGNE